MKTGEPSTKHSWKSLLGGAIHDNLGQEIDEFEGQIAAKKAGRLSDKLFAETRLRRGAYGQRYDNGKRHDGTGQKTLAFPNPGVTKGVDTVWDAPGMQRIKIPYGELSSAALETLAEVAEEYSNGILHVTTRQELQLHFVHIEDSPDLHRRLAAVQITTREACGNSVRNITACRDSGVCALETFDVSPYAEATHQFLLGHPDIQDFGRKFKITFAGCSPSARTCNHVSFHDFGAIATVQNGQRGFALYVGGGLGAVPVVAKELMSFCPAAELLPVAQAVCRVFARLGERQSRARSRIKFLVQKVGIETFRTLVAEERQSLRPDPRWTTLLPEDEKPQTSLHEETPRCPAALLDVSQGDERARKWVTSNINSQKQEGYYTATVSLSLGDFTTAQAFGLAALVRRYAAGVLRCTADQNLTLRWLSGTDVLAVYAGLARLGLADPDAGTILNVASCPGTDTCKLGISASRGLAGELRRRLKVIQNELDPAVARLQLKTSGCFNGCSQHHIADVGFLGVSRTVGGRKVPYFNVVVGGQSKLEPGAYGLVVGAVPSKSAPKALELITALFVNERTAEESFHAFTRRVGKARFRTVLRPIQKPPSYAEDPSYYSDWRDPREYSIGDLGVGECAGEIVPFVEFGLQKSDDEQLQALQLLDAGDTRQAGQLAYRSMLTAARSLVHHISIEVRDEEDDIIAQFQTHLVETRIFWDRYAKGKFAGYLSDLHRTRRFEQADAEIAHRTLDEARLFLEACHACYARITAQAGSETQSANSTSSAADTVTKTAVKKAARKPGLPILASGAGQ